MTRTDLSANMGAAKGATKEDNAPSFSKEILSPLDEANVDVGRTVTSSMNFNEEGLSIGSPTPAYNSGSKISI